MSDQPKINIICCDTETTISVPLNSKFGTLRFQFEEDGKIKEFPIFTEMLHDLFVKDLYCHKALIKT